MPLTALAERIASLEGAYREVVPALAEQTGVLATIEADEHRNHRLINVVLVMGVGLVLSAVIAVVALYHAGIAESKANEVHTSAVASCQASNKVRTDDIALWDGVLTLTTENPPTPRTAAQTAEIAQFKAFVAATFAPAAC